MDHSSILPWSLLAFGLLGLVIWQNRVQIRGVLSRPLDLKLLVLAAAIYLVGMFGTFVRWFFLVRVIEPTFKFSATVLSRLDRHGFQPGHPRSRRR